MTQFSYLTSLGKKLVNGLRRLQSTNLDLSLVPLNDNKQPLGDGWQNRPMKAAELLAAISNGGVEVPLSGETKKIQLQGIGLLTGRPIPLDDQTYYLMALDQDGASAESKILELSGGEPLPKTVAFTSGRVGRCQYLFLVPEKYKNTIRTKKVKTGMIGDDGKAEQLEFRWSNLQSVLPPSVHPTTGEYCWVEGCAIDEIEIALAPTWVIEQMKIDPTMPTTPLLETLSSIALPRNGFQKTWTDIDFARAYLSALSSERADDYDDWLTVGMALHSVDDSLLAFWDSWSQQSSKYKPGECEKKWRSFSENGGVSLGTLGHMAKLDGWCFPKTSKSDRPGHHRTQTQNCSQENISPSKKPTVNRDNSPNRDTSNPDRLSLSATVATVTTILKAGLLDYSERAELDSVQTRSAMSKAAFWQLVAAIRCSLDEVNDEDTDRFNQLIDWHNATLDLKKVLPHQLSEAFFHDASVLNIDPVSLWQYFLPAALSLAGKRVNLDVESHIIPTILWTCLVSESGTGKSRAENLILT
jgi:Bifunctional DNA primase/polymerase, N-terminal/Primase C terminal 2 (PriCT-2)